MHVVALKMVICTALLAPIFVACSDPDSMKGKSEGKGKRISTYVPPGGAEAKLNSAPIAKARYRLEVFKHYDVAESRLSICNGEVPMTIWSDFGGLTPQGVIDCIVFGKMDLSKMMAGDDDEAAEIDMAQMKSYKGFGKVIRIPNPKSGAYTFSPPVPMIIGPVIQDPSIFKDFTMSDTLSIQGSDPSVGSFSDRGAVFYQVHEVNSTFTPEGASLVFDKVIHYDRNVSGFLNTPDRGSKLLYPKMEFWFNTQPIAIPQIILRAMPSQMGGFAGGMAKVGDAALGPLTIKLTLISHTQL